MQKTLMIVAGGTGGHIFPAAAIAEAITATGTKVFWMGTSSGLEQQLIGLRFPIDCVSLTGVRGKNFWQKTVGVGRMANALYRALGILRKRRPNLVLSLGGYAAGPGSLAAFGLRIPLAIHEQNAVSGLTNRLLTKVAHRTFQAFPGTFSPSSRVVTTGNPIRAELLELPAPRLRFQYRPGPLRILVLGGSRGAHFINDMLVTLVQTYSDKMSMDVWHQTGEKDLESVRSAYQKHSFKCRVEAFITPMAEAYGWADVVIARAGALTVSEISAVGVASILIPYPYATDDHQWHNGSYLQKAGAAILLRESSVTPTILANVLQEFISNRSKLLDMAERAQQLNHDNATQIIVNECARWLS